MLVSALVPSVTNPIMSLSVLAVMVKTGILIGIWGHFPNGFNKIYFELYVSEKSVVLLLNLMLFSVQSFYQCL